MTQCALKFRILIRFFSFYSKGPVSRFGFFDTNKSIDYLGVSESIIVSNMMLCI